MCKLHKILETLSQGSIPSENDIGFLLNCKEDELQPWPARSSTPYMGAMSTFAA